MPRAVASRPAGAGRRPVAPPRRLLLLFVAGSVLLAGVGGCLAAGLWWDHHDQQAAATGASDTAAAISAAIGNALRADRNFDAAVQEMVVTFPDLTNRRLASWAAALDARARYRGTAGFSFVEPVAASDLPAFIASVQADPPSGASPTPYTVLPPGRRPQYCLTRFGIRYHVPDVPIGSDPCALGGSPLDRIRRSGESRITTFRSILEAGWVPHAYANEVRHRFKNLFVIASPTYDAGSSPTTVSARVASFKGWMLGTFSIHALLHEGVHGTSEVRVALRYRRGNGPWRALGTAGAASGAHLVATRTVHAGPGLDAHIEAVVTSATSTNPLLSGLLVAIAGTIISLLVFGLLVYLATSRRRAFQLVEDRTRELRHQALHDALTNLPNRALLYDRAEQMLARARREPLALGALYVDLDNFKDINDTLGHGVGDDLLRSVATRIQTALRATDTVGRMGGDEFLVLVEGASLDAGPERVAERLLAALGEPFLLEASEQAVVSVRASIGAAVGLRPTADELFRDADIALYAAKAAGKGRVVLFKPEMQIAAEDRRGLENDLRRAVDAEELFVLYQPIVDLETMTVRAAEALMRWRHPTRGVLGPDAFISLAEETGLVVPLGTFVLDQACRQAATWRARGHELGISVNVSARQLEGDHIVDDVQGALERHHLPAGLLALELTETTLLDDSESTMRILARLKDIGVRISLDDFGTGYSSLSYLRMFPIDVLKIDRSFITRLGDNATSRPLVHSVIELGKALGIETVAEGVEDPSQLEWLQREHCDSGQGYLFGEPVSPEELELQFLPLPHGATCGSGNRSRSAAPL